MTLRNNENSLLRLALSLTLVGLTFGFSPYTRAQDRDQEGSSVIPEGSGSIIQPLSWFVTGENVADLAELAEQVRTAIQQFEGAILVKDEKDFLVLSLPSAKLTALHQMLSALGTLTGPEPSEEYKAPTTLLRLMLGPVPE